MKYFIFIFGGLLSTTSLQAWTSKQKTITWSFGGCGAGLAIGAYLDSNDKSEDKSSQATLAANTAIGCMLGLVGSWVFIEDEQKPLVQENANLRAKLDQYEAHLTGKGIEDFTPKRDYFDGLTQNQPARNSLPTDLSRLIDPSCEAFEYSLGFDDDPKASRYIPVDGKVAIQAFRYYLVVPKDGSDRDCVRPHASYGYLNKEFTNLSDILIDKALRKNGGQ